MTETAPVDLVRATLEQAWQADCLADIYLARQVVDLRGLVAVDRVRIVELEAENAELRAELAEIRSAAGAHPSTDHRRLLTFLGQDAARRGATAGA